MKIKEYLLEHYENDTNQFAEIVEHGCASGVAGFCYYHETVAFYEKFEDEIWEILNNTADECGYDDPIKFIASFKGSKDVSDAAQFKNLLAWFAIEHVSAEILEDEELSHKI